MVAWVYLIIAGIFEVIWVICLKYSEGFTRLIPSIITLITMSCSFFITFTGYEKFTYGYRLCCMD